MLIKYKKKLIIFALAVTLALAGAALFTDFFHLKPAKYVAIVNNQEISTIEYTYFLNKLKKQMEILANLSSAEDAEKKAFWKGKLPGTVNSAEEYLRDQALDSVVGYEIQLIKAKEKKIKLTNSEIQNVKKKLAQQGIVSEEDSMIEMNLELVKKFMNEEMKATKISDDDIKKHYLDNRDKFDNVSIRQAFISIKDGPSPSSVDTARNLASDVLTKFRKDQSINGYLDRTYDKIQISANPEQKIISRNDSVPSEVVNWIFEADAGKTGIIDVENGFYVIKILTKLTSFEQQRDKIREDYINLLYANKLNMWRRDEKFKVEKNEKVFNSIKI